MSIVVSGSVSVVLSVAPLVPAAPSTSSGWWPPTEIEYRPGTSDRTPSACAVCSWNMSTGTQNADSRSGVGRNRKLHKAHQVVDWRNEPWYDAPARVDLNDLSCCDPRCTGGSVMFTRSLPSPSTIDPSPSASTVTSAAAAVAFAFAIAAAAARAELARALAQAAQGQIPEHRGRTPLPGRDQTTGGRGVCLEGSTAGGEDCWRRRTARGGAGWADIGSSNIAVLRFGAQAVAWAHWAFRRVQLTRYGRERRPSAAVTPLGGGRVGSVIRDQLAMARRTGGGGSCSSGSAGAPMRRGWAVGLHINKAGWQSKLLLPGVRASARTM
eukprot:SAG22_NODE_3344_length_1767_cov_1.121703_2_plen_325_part_00